MKSGEKQHTMLAQYRVLSATFCVCDVKASGFCTNLPGKLITGDIKIFVQNKIFSRPTLLSGPYVTGTKQLFLSSLWKALRYLGIFKQMNYFWTLNYFSLDKVYLWVD